MRDRRQGMINRDDTFDGDDGPAPSFNAVPTMREADAALYGALSRVDSKRKAVERTRFGAFKITSLGLEVGEGAQEKDWKEAGEFIFQVDSALQWLIGDWLLYGAQLHYGDIPKLADEFDRDAKTLHHYKQICEKFELTRRRVELTFGHHESARALSSSEQDRALDYAIEHGLSVAAFRKWIKMGMPVGGLLMEDSSPALPLSNDPAREEFYGAYMPEANRYLFGIDRIEDLPKNHRKQAATRAQWISDYYATLAKQLKGGK